MTATIKKIGGSLAIIIPKPMADGLRAGESIDLTEHGGGILVMPKRRRAKRAIQDVVKDIDSKDYARLREEFDNDAPVGREIW